MALVNISESSPVPPEGEIVCVAVPIAGLKNVLSAGKACE